MAGIARILVCKVLSRCVIHRASKGVDVSDGTHDDVESIVPPSLADRIRSYHSAGPAWLQELPGLIATCVNQWGLTLLPAFEPGGDSSWTAPVKRNSGELAVLQITVPLPVHHDHVTALRAWSGRGAVRLFAHDPAIRATLMECCVPGIDAAELSPDEADAVALQVLPQLWSARSPIRVSSPSLMRPPTARK